MSKSSPWVAWCDFHGPKVSSPSMCNSLNKTFKRKMKRSTYKCPEPQSSFSPLSHLPFPEWFLREKKHLKYTLGPDPSPGASSFLRWSRQKALKWALWDDSYISFLSSTFMLQEVKVLERNGFADTQLSFPSLCPAHVFIWLGFSSLLLPDKINLTAYDIMLKILNWMLPYGFHCSNDCCMGEIQILQWPGKVAGMSFLFPLYSKDISR